MLSLKSFIEETKISKYFNSSTKTIPHLTLLELQETAKVGILFRIRYKYIKF